MAGTIKGEDPLRALQCRDGLADGGLRPLELASGGREAARVRDGDKHPQLI